MSFEDVQKYSGIDPDYSKKDMYNQIESGIAGKGEFPECTFSLTTPPHFLILIFQRDRLLPDNDA